MAGTPGLKCDWACENRSSDHRIIVYFSSLLYHNLINIYATTTKPLSLMQKLMGFFCSLRNGILHSELKILAKI